MPLNPPVRVPRPPRPEGAVRIIGPLLKEYLEAQIKASHRPPKSWHASSLGKTCFRQLFYERMGFPPERWTTKPEWRRDADAGTALHEVYQKYFVEMGVLHEVEQTTSPNIYVIGGRKDGVSHGGERFKRFVGPGEKGLVEIKTLKEEAFEALPDHYKFDGFEDQMQIYFQLDAELLRGLLVCVNRNDSRIKEFLIERNDPYGKYLLARAAYLEACYQANKVPMAEPSFACNFCAHPNRCDKDDLLEAA